MHVVSKGRRAPRLQRYFLCYCCVACAVSLLGVLQLCRRRGACLVEWVEESVPGPVYAYGDAGNTAGDAVDFCNGDPNIVVVNDVECETDTVLLSVLHLRANPFHALHDVAWAVVHYAANCVGRSQVLLYLNATLEHPALCMEQEFAAPPPTWGACLLYTAAVSMGIPERNIFIDATNGKHPVHCARKTVHFGDPRAFEPAAFRGTNYLGRTRNNTGFVHMPARMKSFAFTTLARAVKFAVNGGRPLTRSNSKVHVLLYDRMDTKRRIWVDADSFYLRIEDDPRLEVEFISACPNSFREQLLLYQWADILVAPHGANMANTIFMEAGTDVVEIWPCCQDNTARDPRKPRNWTGWHAGLLGLKLQYAQCHDARFPLKPQSELHNETAECKYEIANPKTDRVGETRQKGLRLRVNFSELEQTIFALIPAQVERINQTFIPSIFANALRFRALSDFIQRSPLQ